jgi:hypothetical protein
VNRRSPALAAAAVLAATAGIGRASAQDARAEVERAPEPPIRHDCRFVGVGEVPGARNGTSQARRRRVARRLGRGRR